MAISVLLILAVLWAAFFAWPLLKGRTTTGRRADSIGDFSYRLGVIGKTGGHGGRRRPAPSPIPLGVSPARSLANANGVPLGANGPTRSQRRRREVLMILGAAFLVTLLVAVTMGSPVTWGLQLLVDVTLGAYVFLLVRMQQRALEQRAKVRYLPNAAPSPSPLVLRRTASNHS